MNAVRTGDLYQIECEAGDPECYFTLCYRLAPDTKQENYYILSVSKRWSEGAFEFVCSVDFRRQTKDVAALVAFMHKLAAHTVTPMGVIGIIEDELMD